MLRAASRSCKAGTSPPVCCTLLLASLTVVLVVAASSSPPLATANSHQPQQHQQEQQQHSPSSSSSSVGAGSLPQVFTNSFLVKLRGVNSRQQADLIARRNGFENWGSVFILSISFLIARFYSFSPILPDSPVQCR